MSHALRMLNSLKSVQPNKKSNWRESSQIKWKSVSIVANRCSFCILSIYLNYLDIRLSCYGNFLENCGNPKRYLALQAKDGRRLLSPGSFVRSIEKRSDSRSSWFKSHGRIYVRCDILDTFKTLKAQCVFSTDTAFLQTNKFCCRLRCEGNKGEKIRLLHLYCFLVQAATSNLTTY